MVRKLAPSELMQEIRPHLTRECQVGALVGVAIPNLGYAAGVLWGSLRHLSHALMSIEAPKTYKNFRKAVQGLTPNETAKKEIEVWGCTSSQVASIS